MKNTTLITLFMTHPIYIYDKTIHSYVYVAYSRPNGWTEFFFSQIFKKNFPRATPGGCQLAHIYMYKMLILKLYRLKKK